jgi:tRNA (guanine-N7-)-methyltransferase
VGKKKLVRFAEMLAFDNVVHADSDEVLNRRHDLYGRWAWKFFGSAGPIVLELGCGKGEYTIALARLFPGMNFLGVDIKGARIWKGAKYAFENKMQNAGFLRTRIEFISSFFASDEIEQVWLTFPDPQPSRARKRLTSPAFLNRYRGFLRKGGLVHLKTDNMELYNYTLRVIRANSLELLMSTDDIYHTAPNDKLLSIRTYYEQQFLDQGKPIAYLRFRIDCPHEIKEPDADQ